MNKLKDCAGKRIYSSRRWRRAQETINLTVLRAIRPPFSMDRLHRRAMFS